MKNLTHLILVAVVLYAGPAFGYKILLYHTTTTLSSGQTVASTVPTDENDIQWTGHEAAYSYRYGTSYAPPIFFDVSTVPFFIGNKTSDVSRSAQISAVRNSISAWDNALGEFNASLDLSYGGSNDITIEEDISDRTVDYVEFRELLSDMVEFVTNEETTEDRAFPVPGD